MQNAVFTYKIAFFIDKICTHKIKVLPLHRQTKTTHKKLTKMAKMTKKEMMDEMIFIYEAFSTAKQVVEKTREKLYKYSAQRNREQVERCYNAVMNARNAKDASAGIFCCTGIALKF